MTISSEMAKDVLLKYYSTESWSLSVDEVGGFEILWEGSAAKPTLAELERLYTRYVRDSVLSALSIECNRRIRSCTGVELSQTQWVETSQNLQDIKTDFVSKLISTQEVSDGEQKAYKHACEVLNKKNKILIRYKELKSLVLSLDEDEIQGFDVADDGIWGLNLFVQGRSQ